MSVVEDGSVFQVGTYNGNPLGMAAARANLLEVMTPDAYEHLDAPQRPHPGRLPGRDREAQPAGLRRRRRLEGLRDVLAAEDRRLRDVQGQPGRRARRARLALQHEPRHLHDAGREEEWTLSVTHTDESVDRYVAVFEEMAAELTAWSEPREGVARASPRARRAPPIASTALVLADRRRARGWHEDVVRLARRAARHLVVQAHDLDLPCSSPATRPAPPPPHLPPLHCRSPRHLGMLMRTAARPFARPG